MSIRIPGIQVDVQGDITQLQGDLTRARGLVRAAGKDISNALNNALSPGQINAGINSLIRDLGQVQRHAKLTGRDFEGLGVELKEVAHLVGLNEKAWQGLQQKMLQNRAAQTTERALAQIARQTGASSLEMAKLRLQLGDAEGAIRVFGREASTHFQAVTGRIFNLRNAIAGLGLALMARDFVRTAASFETLEISLETVTGSAAAAKAATGWIADFTKNTPFQLEQVADAFRRLAAYGMEPTRYLQTLGDTASAMGKSLEQAVEMFADAATGEFERLKEFGVKAKTEGEQVTFSWVENGRQMTKTVEKTQTEITEALTGIFGRFQGGMKRQMDAWDGLVSNLVDHWTMFQKEVMDSGPFQEMKAQLKDFLAYLDTAEGKQAVKGWAEDLGRMFQGAVELARGLVPTLKGVAATAKTMVADINALPGWVLGAGVVGALLFGKQGAVAIGVGLAIVGNLAREMDMLDKTLAAGGTVADWFNAPRDTTGLFGLDFGEYEKRLNVLMKHRAIMSGATPISPPGSIPELDQLAAQVQKVTTQAAAGAKGLSDSLAKKLTEAYRSAQVEYARLTQGEVAARIQAEELKLAKLRESLAKAKNLTADQQAQLVFIEQITQAKILQLRAKAQDETNKIWSDAEWDYLKGEKARYETTQKNLNLERDAALELARLTEDTGRVRQMELEAYAQAWRDKGLRGLELDRLIAAKRAEINKTSLDRMLEDWRDLTKGWDDIAKNFLEGIQKGFADTFRAIFEGVGSGWESMWAAMKNIAYQALAAVATKLASAGLAQLVVGFLPGLGGLLETGGKDAGSTVSGLANVSSLFSAPGTGGIGGWLTKTFGTAAATEYGAAAPTLFGVGAAGWNAALGAAGLGALGGSLLGPMVFGGKGYSTAGSSLGAGLGAGAASLLATAGLIPVAGPLAPVLGGVLGGLGGGFLGGMFGGGDREPWEDPDNIPAHWERLKGVLGGLKEDMAGLNDQMGEMAPLAAGAGDYLGGYGEVLGGVLEKVSGLTPGTAEYARVVSEELNPAFIIQAGLVRDLDAGYSQLDAHKKALTATIDSLLAGGDLEAQQQEQLVDLLLAQSGTVEDLTAKYDRYQEIREQLTKAHELGADKVRALVAEGQALHAELGLEETAMGNLNSVITQLTQSIQDLAQALGAVPSSKTIDINYRVNNRPDSYHTGGLVRHTGGPIPRGHDYPELAAVPRMHSGGLRPDERWILALAGEYVMRPQAVDHYGLGWMEAANRLALPKDYMDLARPVYRPAPAGPAPAGGDGPAAGAVVHLHLTLNVAGDVVGEAGALARVTDAAMRGVRDGLLEASQNGQVVVYAEGVGARDWNDA